MAPAPSRLARLRSRGSAGASGALAMLAQALHLAASLALMLLAARFLSPAEYGIYSIAAIFLMLLQDLTFAGITHYLVTQKGDEQRLLNTTFWIIAGFATLGATLLLVLAPLLARLFDAPELELVLQLMAAVQPLGAYTAWGSAVLMRRKRLKLHFTLLSLQNGLSLLGGVLALLLLQSIWALVAYRYIRTLSGLLGYAWVIRVWPRWRLDRDLARSMLGYASHLYGTKALQFFSNYGADLVLGAMLSVGAAGLYRFGNRMAMVPVELIGGPLRSFALAQFGEANRKDAPFGPPARSFTATMTFLMGGIGATLAIFGDEIIRIVFQPEYLAAQLIMVALLARAILGIGDSLLEPVLSAAGRTRQIFLQRTVFAVAAIGVIFAAARYGDAAVASALALLSAIATAVSLWQMQRACAVGPGPVLAGIAQAMALVGLYTIGAWGVSMAMRATDLGSPLLSLVLALAACGLIGLAAAALAIRLRVLDLRVFAGK